MTHWQTEHHMKMKDLLSRRAAGIQRMQACHAAHRQQGSERRGLLDSQDSLRLINEGLAEMAEVSRAMDGGGGVAKTKRELIGSLTAWSDQMADANKNPATSAGEKLFNARAVARIAQILMAKESKE